MSGAGEAVAITAETPARAAYNAMLRAFQNAGLETPDIDARFLLQGVLGLDGAKLIADPQMPVGAAAELLTNAVRRRLNREPVSRILGWREFYGRRFTITPDVLDPRPDTESVITLVIDIARDKGWFERPIRFADIGAGSGAIALTLLAEMPLATAVATDVSRAALAVTEANAIALGVADRLTLVETRGLAGCDGAFDLIVSNPPYIPAGDILGLVDEVRRFDPLLALDGGADGLQIFREIFTHFNQLSGDFVAVFEVGDGQSDAVLALLQAARGAAPRLARDLGAHIRAVAAEIHR